MHGVSFSLTTQRSADSDQMFVCPYDAVHRISAKTYVSHILKCKKNFPTVQLETCPFNARHKFRQPEIAHHITVCPDRYFLELEQQSEGVQAPASKTGASSSQYLDFSDDESWDEEITRRQQNIVAESRGGASFCGPRSSNARVAAVHRMKAELQAQHRRAMKAEDLPSRRPLTVTKCAEVLEGKCRGATADGEANSRARPRLAANFTVKPSLTEMRGRGRIFKENAPLDVQRTCFGRGRSGFSSEQAHLSRSAAVLPSTSRRKDGLPQYGSHYDV